MVKLHKKGNAVPWIIAIISVFVVGVVYIVFAQPWDILYDKLTPGVDAAYQPTVSKLQTLWQNWPILMILGIVLWPIIRMVKNEPDTGYY